jgi:5-methylcytosine-specific restriction endonuclease McrA
MAPRKRKTTRRDDTIYGSRWRALVEQAKAYHEPTCYFCGNEIDMTLPGRHQWSCEVHHLQARAFGGPTIVPLDELALAHKSCNASHGARLRNLPRSRQQLDQRSLEDEYQAGYNSSLRVGIVIPLS